MNKTKLVVTLFVFLATSEIKYVILRNYDELPEVIGDDIDIFIDNYNLQEIDFMLKNFATSHEIEVRSRLEYRGFKSYLLIIDSVELIVDFYNFFFWRGIEYVRKDNIYNNSTLHLVNGYRIASKGNDLAIVLLKELLGAKRIRSKISKDKISRFSFEDKYGFLDITKPTLGKSQSMLLYKLSLKPNTKLINILGVFVRSRLMLINIAQLLEYIINSILNKGE